MDKQELAKELFDALISKARDNGSTIVTLENESPDWMSTACYAAHGRMLPDDERYQMIAEAAEMLANDQDVSEYEPSCYTSTLTGWLASRNDRYGYCDDALSEGLADASSLISILQAGMTLEFQETYALLSEALDDALDTLESAG